MKKEAVVKEKRKPSVFIAVLPIILMLVIVGVGFSVLKLPLSIVLLFSGVAAAIIAKFLGYTWKEMLDAVGDKIKQSSGALYILIAVGMMIGSWMASGTLPMMIYYGIQIINVKFLYVTAFLVTAIVSVLSGTSYGSIGTMGVVCIGIATTYNLSLPITAGACIAGAYFGDKLSPLSDTTVLASVVTNTDIYEHIKHTLWTTIPASILGLIVYFIVGINNPNVSVDSDMINSLLNQFDQIYNWNIILLLPVVIVFVGSIMKFPTVPVMFVSSIVACILAMVVQGVSFSNVFTACASGFKVDMMVRPDFDFTTVLPELTKLTNRGGMSSMMETLLILLVVYIYGGIISCTGCLDVILQKLQSKVKTDSGIITSTVISGLLMSMIAGISYLSIIVTGELYSDVYKKRGLASCNLSRTLEDSGTVITVLIPWTGGAVYAASTLGVATLDYLPWAVMNYTGFVFAIILAFTGIGIKKIKQKQPTQP